MVVFIYERDMGAVQAAALLRDTGWPIRDDLIAMSDEQSDREKIEDIFDEEDDIFYDEEDDWPFDEDDKTYDD